MPNFFNERQEDIIAQKPTHAVIQPIETKTPNPKTGKNVFYNRVGAGWENDNGTIVCQFNSIPVDGKFIVCRQDAEEAKDAPDGE